MLLYHGTNYKQKILDSGFKLRNGEVQRFGKGIYLTPDKNEALGFGKDIITVQIPDCYIHSMEYKTIAKKYGLSFEEQEGEPQIECYAKKFNHKAISIKYNKLDQEVIVYDVEIIKIVE